MKRYVLPLLLAALLTLSACGGSSQPAPAPGGGQPAAKKITIRLAHEQAATHYLTKYIQQWADDVKAKSNGNVDVQIFPAGQLYKDADSIQQISGGGLDMGMAASTYLSNIIPQYKVLDLPFISDGSLEGTKRLVDPAGPVGSQLAKAAEAKNVKVLGWFSVGGWSLFDTKRPVHTMADMKGLKIRVLGGAPQEKAMEALGASAVTLPAPELVTAIKTGTIDGMIATTFFWDAQLGDVKYGVFAPGLYSNFIAITIGKKFFDGLPPETQKLLTDTFNAASADEGKYVADLDAKAIASLKSKGDDYYPLPADEIARWKEATKPVYKAMESVIGADIIAKAQALQ